MIMGSLIEDGQSWVLLFNNILTLDHYNIGINSVSLVVSHTIIPFIATPRPCVNSVSFLTIKVGSHGI